MREVSENINQGRKITLNCHSSAHIKEKLSSGPVCASATPNSSLSLEARMLKFCIYTPHINTRIVTIQVFEILSVGRHVGVFLWPRLGCMSKVKLV